MQIHQRKFRFLCKSALLQTCETPLFRLTWYNSKCRVYFFSLGALLLFNMLGRTSVNFILSKGLAFFLMRWEWYSTGYTLSPGKIMDWGRKIIVGETHDCSSYGALFTPDILMYSCSGFSHGTTLKVLLCLPTHQTVPSTLGPLPYGRQI